MQKTKSLWFLLAMLTFVAVLCLVPLTSFAMAAADEYGLEELPDPIDPQSWRMQRDMTWDDWTANPFIDWREDTTIEPERVLRGALILVDFPDQPFLVTQPVGSDPIGNPRVGNVATEDLADFWKNFLNTPSTDNNFMTVNEYWRENTFGSQMVEMDAFGPFTTSKFEFQYGLGWSSGEYAYQGFRDQFPRSTGSAGLGYEAFDLAEANGIKFFDEEGNNIYDFMFVIHAGYDQSTTWEEIGTMMFSTQDEIPYALSGEARIDRILDMVNTPGFDLATEFPNFYLFTDTSTINTVYPDYKEENLLSYRYKNYADFFYDYLNEHYENDLAAWKAENPNAPIEEFAIKFQAEADEEFEAIFKADFVANVYPDMVQGILLEKLNDAKQVAVDNDGLKWARTRYVPWTSWYSGVGFWSTESTITRTNRPHIPRTLDISIQGESDGMGTYAHEFGHIRGMYDNYNGPLTTPQKRSFTGPWELMSRGSFSGPGGKHDRYSIPSVQGGSAPPTQMLFPKIFNGFTTEEDIVDVTVAELKDGPVVTEIVAHNMPTKNGNRSYGVEGKVGLRLTGFTDQTPKDNNTLDPLNNSSGNLLSGTGNTASIDPEKWNYGTFATVVHDVYTVEVVDTTGYDSFAHDHGVLIAKNATNQVNYDPNSFVIDSHPDPIGLIDYLLPDGTPYELVQGDMYQLIDATFHAGVHDNPDYGDTYEGITVKTSGDVVNEYVDAHNNLHFYILNKFANTAANGEYLSYQVAVRSTASDAAAVGGSVTLTKGAFEPASAGRYAVQHYTLKHSADADMEDIFRISLDSDNATVLNNLYALAPNEEISFAVYIKATGGAVDSLPGDLGLTVTSETNAAKIASEGAELILTADNTEFQGLAASYPYVGSAVTPGFTLLHNGVALVEGTHYEVSHSNHQAVGTATLTVRGINTHSGEVSTAFEIVAAEPKAALNAPAVIYIDGDRYLEYTFTVAEIVQASSFTFKLKVDQSLLELAADKEPTLYLEDCWVSILDYNADNGSLELKVQMGGQGLDITTAEEVPLVGVLFKLKDWVGEAQVDTSLEGKLLATPEIWLFGENRVTFEATTTVLREKAYTKISKSILQFDLNENGRFDQGDIDMIIDRYYLYTDNDPEWDEAYFYDLDDSKRVDAGDLLLFYAMLRNQG